EIRKQARREAIISAARQMFIRHGYGPVTIEAIAKGAHVSPGTVYNAFATKHALLAEVFLADIAAPSGKVGAILTRSLSQREAVDAVVGLYFDWLDEYPKPLVRTFMASVMTQPDLYALRQAQIDAIVLQGICEIFGVVSADRIESPQGRAASVVFNLADSEFRRWVLSDSTGVEIAKRRTRELIDIVWPALDLSHAELDGQRS
ncbi:MAG: TetR/AcrR family transcriptional regulator, partial [Pseudomonadota bacterium]